MPVLNPSQSKVLVTGASGFIGAQTAFAFLQRGFSVRGTVRSPRKGEYLDNLFKDFGPKWDWIIVEDLESPGGFDKAVKGVDGIAHVASPFHFNTGPDVFKTVINPAVNGTLSVLRSARTHGKDVKRLVVTSSFAAIRNSQMPLPHVFTEKDWNSESPKEVEEKGNAASPRAVYQTSKTLAERAAWDYVATERPAFDLVTLCPPLVLGPFIHEVASPDALNTSVKYVWQYLEGKSAEGAATSTGNVVDVRDLAEAHVEAFLHDEAGGERFAISSRTYAWQDILDSIHVAFAENPELSEQFPKTPIGQKGTGALTPKHELDSSKSKRLLGIHYRSLDETVKALLLVISKKGWRP